MSLLSNLPPSVPSQRGDQPLGATAAIELPGLRVRPREVDSLRRFASAAWPEPAAGMLLGRASCEVVVIDRVTVLRPEALRGGGNALVKPTDWFAEGLVAKALGFELVGVWIARPRGEARHVPLDPSIVRDGLSLLAIGTNEGVADSVEALRWENGLLRQQTLEIVVPARIVSARETVNPSV